MRALSVEIAEKPETLVCVHWRSFPPRGAIVASGRTPEELRAQKVINEPEYQRVLVWQKVCGLTVMTPEKCLTCPHARTAELRRGLPTLVSLDKKIAVPSLDMPSLESSARHRKLLADITGGK